MAGLGKNLNFDVIFHKNRIFKETNNIYVKTVKMSINLLISLKYEAGMGIDE